MVETADSTLLAVLPDFFEIFRDVFKVASPHLDKAMLERIEIVMTKMDMGIRVLNELVRMKT